MNHLDRQLAEIEELYNRQRHSGRMMLKAIGHTHQGPLHTTRPGNGYDLLKAETALRRLEREGALTDKQCGEAWRRLSNLRPTAVIRIN